VFWVLDSGPWIPRSDFLFSDLAVKDEIAPLSALPKRRELGAWTQVPAAVARSILSILDFGFWILD